MGKIARLLCLGFVLVSQHGEAAIVLKQSKDMAEACLWLQAATQRKEDCVKYSVLSPMWQNANSLERAALKKGLQLQGKNALIVAYDNEHNRLLAGIGLSVVNVAITLCSDGFPIVRIVNGLGSLVGIGSCVISGKRIAKLDQEAEAMKSAMLEHAKKHTVQEK